MDNSENLENFFNPRSIVVIGASNDPQKIGFALVSNLIKNPKRKIYPVTLSEKKIMGMKAFSSVLEIDEPLDLAIIAVRADVVPNILAECGEKKIPNAIIISSGFKESGQSGRELEELISQIAKEKKITLLGPNCLGVINTKNQLNASFSGKEPLVGKLAFISQSGALGTALIDLAIGEGVGFSKFVSLGNEAQLTEVDFLKYLEKDQETSAILMYLENLNNGPIFLDLIKRITAKKPVVVIKAGMGSHGNLAVQSHTGALAPQAAVFVAACKQAGAVTVSSIRGFFNVVKILSQANDPLKPLQKLIILTNGGGPSVIAADLIDRSKSVSLMALSEKTKESLKEVLPTMAAVGNPVDIIGDALAERYDKALAILSEVEEADAIMVILTPQMMTEAVETAKVLAKYKNKKIILPVFIGMPSVEAGRIELIKNGFSSFLFPRDVIDALDYLAKGAIKPNSLAPSHVSPVGITGVGQMMDFNKTINLLEQYDISISGKFIWKKEDLSEALNFCGHGPYAMKAISSQLIHKTEIGAVRLNIFNFDEAGMVWEELWQKFIQLEGVLVQKVESGREVIIGLKRDATFGSIIVFGLGGIFTETLKDTVMRIAPVSKDEAFKMMQEIKGFKILQGLRGEKPVNFDMLAEIVVKLSKLAIDHPEIKEIDLNPVICSNNSATIVDARIMV